MLDELGKGVRQRIERFRRERPGRAKAIADGSQPVATQVPVFVIDIEGLKAGNDYSRDLEAEVVDVDRRQVDREHVVSGLRHQRRRGAQSLAPGRSRRSAGFKIDGVTAAEKIEARLEPFRSRMRDSVLPQIVDVGKILG